MSKIKWATAQPLTGGMAIGAYQVYNTPPEFIITSEFGQANTQECINYFNDTLNLNVPIINMDAKYEMFMTDKDEKLFKKLNVDIDVVNYLPICSGLSALTTNCSKCKVENEQNDNQYQLTKMILDKIEPNVAVYENAPALYTKSGAEVLEKVKDISKEMDYSLTVERVDTHNHGIPQHRQRTFAYFWKDSQASILKYENIIPKELCEYLAEVPKSATAQNFFYKQKGDYKDVSYEFCENLCKENESLQNMMKRYGYTKPYGEPSWIFIHHHVGFDKAIAWAETKISETNSEKKYVKALRDYKRIKEKTDNGGNYFDMSCFVGEIKPAINAVTWKIMGHFKHPCAERTMNLREYAHLMGLPHNFEFTDWNKNGVMISQNVPIGTARHVATQCELFVHGKLDKSFSWFVKQNNVKQRIDLQEPIMHDIEEW